MVVYNTSNVQFTVIGVYRLSMVVCNTSNVQFSVIGVCRLQYGCLYHKQCSVHSDWCVYVAVWFYNTRDAQFPVIGVCSCSMVVYITSNVQFTVIGVCRLQYGCL